ncbi:MAG TPA: hypothetical protein VHG92_04570 [Afifellaceae bacterium]|nr:hypothetical protein [Afifellaceae bacterium]
MVNGKRGDDPYLDIVHYGDDLGMPEIAAKVRELDGLGDPGIVALVRNHLMIIQGVTDPAYWQQQLMRDLDTIARLAAADRSGGS